MPVTQFPNPRLAPPDGLLAVGGDLTPETLWAAYSQGIFPWPVDMGRKKGVLAWFSPDPRGILQFQDLHLPQSLKRVRRQTKLRFTCNQAFEQVMNHCAQAPRPGQKGTWITPPLLKAYTALHERGLAHSVEVWEDSTQGSELVGGIYGVEVRGVFAGESMFHLRPNASKLALLHLIDLISARGAEWMDIQMITPHMQKLGAKEISRDRYLELLSQTQARGLKLFRSLFP